MIRTLPCHSQQTETGIWKEKIIGLLSFCCRTDHPQNLYNYKHLLFLMLHWVLWDSWLSGWGVLPVGVRLAEAGWSRMASLTYLVVGTKSAGTTGMTRPHVSQNPIGWFRLISLSLATRFSRVAREGPMCIPCPSISLGHICRIKSWQQSRDSVGRHYQRPWREGGESHVADFTTSHKHFLPSIHPICSWQNHLLFPFTMADLKYIH